MQLVLHPLAGIPCLNTGRERNNKLPPPFEGGIGILSGERRAEVYSTQTLMEIPATDSAYFLEMTFQRFIHCG